jgi:enoyl-CoA hydratase/carnithine racemase
MSSETRIAALGQTLAEGILTLTLARPEKLNALTTPMLAALEAGLERARADDVRVVVLRGEGTSFCAGADMVDSLGISDVHGASDFLERLARVLGRISALPKPVVAAVQGHAAGGGAEIALEADLRVVAEDAQLWFPDVGIGSTPASVWQLYRMVGRALTTEMVMLGRRLAAADLSRYAMAQTVVPAADLDDAAHGLAERLRDAGSELSLRHAKRAIDLAAQATRPQDLEANVAAMLVCYWSDEQRQTVDRFRPPTSDRTTP